MEDFEIFMLVIVGFGAVLGWLGHMAYASIFNPVRDAYHTQYVLPSIQKLVENIQKRAGKVPANDALNFLKSVTVIYKDFIALQRVEEVAALLYRKAFDLKETDPSLEISLVNSGPYNKLLLLKWPGLERPFTLTVK